MEVAISNYTCGVCGAELQQRPRGRRRKFCKGDCARIAKNQATAEWRSGGGLNQVHQCLQCGSSWCNLGGQRGPTRFCTDRCRLRHTERRLYAAQPKPCIDCGTVISPLGSRVRCTPCQAQVNRRRNSLHIPQHVRTTIYERDGWVCQLCHGPINREATYPDPNCATPDHIIPRALGGTDDLWNLQTAHWSCNHKKGIRAAGSQLRLAIA